jgi:hypothetical protein
MNNKMKASSLFGTIQPKPKYRDARGKFRKETKHEFRSRYDETAWATLQRQHKIAAQFASTNPYASLLTK